MNIKLTSLRLRMALHLAVMVAGSLLIGVAAIVGIDRLREDMGVAVQGYQQLRQIYDVGFQVATAKRALLSNTPDVTSARSAFSMAASPLETGPTPLHWLNESDKIELKTRLQQAMAALEPMNESARLHESPIIAVDRIFGLLAKISVEAQATIRAKEAAAAHQRQVTLATVAGLSAVIIITAILVGLRLYRAVVHPLDHIRAGVRQFASGDWNQRMRTTAVDQEFASLARDFNQMADELTALYRDLEQKVAARSHELARSERLAGVGYLAAGVAHEINNPLGIIAGYAERSMQLLDRGLDESTAKKIHRSLQIMCDEAFRCRAITDRLLSLARPGSDQRGPVSLAAVAAEVVAALGGMNEHTHRQITLVSNPADDGLVLARDGEMKQVILNLLVNALQAIPETDGRVRVVVARSNNQVEWVVEDNGRGMDASTLSRVFEPFFTNKRDAGRHGTGLGLSIARAIVTDHGGTIEAESAGLGMGSTFRVRLPAMVREAAIASL